MSNEGLLIAQAEAAARQVVFQESKPLAQRAGMLEGSTAPGGEGLKFGGWMTGGGDGGGLTDARLALASFYCTGVVAAQQEDPENPGEYIDGTMVTFCGGYVRVSGIDRKAVMMESLEGETPYFPSEINVFIPGLVQGVSDLYGVWVKLEISSYTGEFGATTTSTVTMESGALKDETTADGFPEATVSYEDSGGWPKVTAIFPLVTVGFVYGGQPGVVHRLHIGGDLVFGQGLNFATRFVQASRYNPDLSRMEEKLRKVSIIGGVAMLGKEGEGVDEWTAMENGDVVACPDPG